MQGFQNLALQSTEPEIGHGIGAGDTRTPQTACSPSVPTPDVTLGAAPDSNLSNYKKCRLPQTTQVISMLFHQS